jgi:type II restriction enzyme
MPKAARDIVEQIDVLWHNGGKGIVAAFEVERTTTITSGIDRFRNLLAAAPDIEVELHIVVPKARGREVRDKIGSPANRKDGLHTKIGYIFLEDLNIRNRSASKVDFEKIKHKVNGE